MVYVIRASTEPTAGKAGSGRGLPHHPQESCSQRQPLRLAWVSPRVPPQPAGMGQVEWGHLE